MFVRISCPIWAQFFLACFLPVMPMAAAEDEVERLISELTLLEQADVGLSPVLGGSDFPPVKGQQQVGVWRSHAVQHATSKQVKRLAELGPAALPALLMHLDDKKETKLLITHDGLIGAMWNDTEVPAPTSAGSEIKAIQSAGANKQVPWESQVNISEHRVTVGDICFVVIGMITNRGYNAVRYQPTACQVINSPTSSPGIAQAVRGIWQKEDLTEALYEHLRQDLARDDPGAATRLLYYYPKRSLAKVLSWLNAAIAKGSASLPSQVNAVAWCEAPQIRQTIQNLVQTSQMPDVVESGAAAFESAPLEAILLLMNRWKAVREGHEASARLLNAALTSRPDAQGYTIDTYVRKASTEALAQALPVLYGLTKPPVQNLAPLLSNTHEGYGQYLRDGTGVHREAAKDHYVDYRICDNIYEIICQALGDKETVCTGTLEEMDGKIKALRSRMKLEASAWPFSKDEIRTRQDTQNSKKIARDKILAQIKSEAKTSLSRWRLTLLEDGLEPDDWSQAALHLLSPADDKPANIQTLLANLHLHLERPFDSLSKEEKEQVTQALARRLTGALDRAPKKSHPNEEIATFAELLCCCPESRTQAALLRLIQKMKAAFSKYGWPEGDVLDTTIMLLDVLVASRVPGAAGYYLQLVQAATPERLDGRTDLEEFFRIMTRDPSSPELAKAAEWCFTRAKSPWRLSRCGYNEADSFGDAGLLSIPAFRASVIEAMGHADIVGQLSIGKTQADYCIIEWNQGGSLGQGVDEGEPAGIKPGQTMHVRHCDAILEGVADPLFAQKGRPLFHIYWPLKKRDEGIKSWVQFLNEMK